jgi:hypothetical protein
VLFAKGLESAAKLSYGDAMTKDAMTMYSTAAATNRPTTSVNPRYFNWAPADTVNEMSEGTAGTGTVGAPVRDRFFVTISQPAKIFTFDDVKSNIDPRDMGVQAKHENRSSYLHYRQSESNTFEHDLDKRWVEHHNRRLADGRVTKEFQAVMRQWSANKSRIAEASNWKYESAVKGTAFVNRRYVKHPDSAYLLAERNRDKFGDIPDPMPVAAPEPAPAQPAPTETPREIASPGMETSSPKKKKKKKSDGDSSENSENEEEEASQARPVTAPEPRGLRKYDLQSSVPEQNLTSLMNARYSVDGIEAKLKRQRLFEALDQHNKMILSSLKKSTIGSITGEEGGMHSATSMPFLARRPDTAQSLSVFDSQRIPSNQYRPLSGSISKITPMQMKREEFYEISEVQARSAKYGVAIKPDVLYKSLVIPSGSISMASGERIPLPEGVRLMRNPFFETKKKKKGKGKKAKR